MSDHSANWHVHMRGDPVLKPRRRPIFHKGCRCGNRWTMRFAILLLLLLAAVGTGTFHDGPFRMREVAPRANH